MQIFIEAIDLNIWEAIEIGPYIPTTVERVTIDGSSSSESITIEKPRDKWSEEDRKRVQYNLKAKNIITSLPWERMNISGFQIARVLRKCGTLFD